MVAPADLRSELAAYLPPSPATLPTTELGAPATDLPGSAMAAETETLLLEDADGNLYLASYAGQNPYNGADVYALSPLGLDTVSTEGNNVFWNIEEDGFWYNPTKRKVQIGTVADGNVTFNKAFGGGEASLKVLNNYVNRFWDRPGTESAVLTADISTWGSKDQDWIIKDYLQHYVRDYGVTTISEYRGPFQDKIGRRIDAVQTSLDAAGTADPSPVCDGINGLIYAGRGQWDNAGISAVAMVPYVGDLAKAGKYGKKAIVIGEGMADVKKVARELDAKWYQAWGKNFPKDRLMTTAELEAAKARNARWIEEKIKEGYEIYDLGIDANRATRSPFYELEKRKYPVTPVAR